MITLTVSKSTTEQQITGYNDPAARAGNNGRNILLLPVFPQQTPAGIISVY
jgi:hypothetical protein